MAKAKYTLHRIQDSFSAGKKTHRKRLCLYRRTERSCAAPISKVEIRITDIENTSWKVLAYGIYARVVDVSEIERVSAANE